MCIDRETSYSDNFTTIPNEILRCGGLSGKAIGIWVYLMSLPKNWKISLKEVCKHLKDGYDSIRAGMLELVEAGYAMKLKTVNMQGQFDYGNWKIFDIKKKNPEWENPNMVNPSLAKAPLLKTEIPVNTKKEQQQPAKAAEKGAKAPVAVFSCLKDIKIQQHDKEWICQNYTEDIVKAAIAYATHPETQIKTSLAQVIKWACKARPEAPIDKAQASIDNRKVAVEIIRKLPKNKYPGVIEFIANGIRAYFEGHSVRIPEVVEYSEANFKDKLKTLLIAWGWTEDQVAYIT